MTTYPREPDFEQFLKVLRQEVPERPTLFEFYLNNPLYEQLAGRPAPLDPGKAGGHDPSKVVESADRNELLAGYKALGRWYADAFAAAGFDYVNFGPGVAFPKFIFREGAHTQEASRSLNDQPLIAGWEDFEKFPWPDTSSVDLGIIEALVSDLPTGVKALFYGPCGVLENLVDLTGYDNLCYMLVDDRDLVAAISQKIGDSLFALNKLFVEHPKVGAMISNDDWGFKTQTMISPADLREFVYPPHREAVRLAHDHGKPILLHSCGNLEAVMDGIIDDLGYDAKHSFEDVIMPIEEVYDTWGDRIAILGGIDVDFLCRSEQDAIYKRSRALVEQTQEKGSYALGSGNSIPEYMPVESFFSMRKAALEA